MVRTEDGGIACICHEHRPECDCEPRSELPKACLVCGSGHCQAAFSKSEACPRFAPPNRLFGTQIKGVPTLFVVPNRLYGVTINSQGEAI